MGSANKKRRYIVTPPLTDWAHNQNAYMPLFGCRCVIASDDALALVKTMPVLQSVGCDGGDLSLDHLQFPWNQQTVTMFGNLRRSPTYNRQYANLAGITSLPSNIYR